mgnify:CR=1 FL=1
MVEIGGIRNPHRVADGGVEHKLEKSTILSLSVVTTVNFRSSQSQIKSTSQTGQLN